MSVSNTRFYSDKSVHMLLMQLAVVAVVYGMEWNSMSSAVDTTIVTEFTKILKYREKTFNTVLIFTTLRRKSTDELPCTNIGMTEVTTDNTDTTDRNDRLVAFGGIGNYAVSCANSSQ